MAKLAFGMNQSLDGYVDHMAFSPSPALFRHFIEQFAELALIERTTQALATRASLRLFGSGSFVSCIRSHCRGVNEFYSPCNLDRFLGDVQQAEAAVR
jgi:hypothetical protein